LKKIREDLIKEYEELERQKRQLESEKKEFEEYRIKELAFIEEMKVMYYKRMEPF
jgi:hypothetical protein